MARKIILGLATSLDAMIEGPNGEYDWCFTDQDYGMTEFLKSVDAIFYGRKSYELMQQASLEETGNQWKDKTSYVFSNTLSASNAYHLVKGDIKSQVEGIKSQPGKNIWLFGGAELTGELLKLKLIDELWLSVHPIILGKGKPLFTSLNHRVKTELVSTKSYATGLVSLKYNLLY